MTAADELHALRSEPVVRFDDSTLPGSSELPHDVRWQDYHGARNSALEALRAFGTVGPMGMASITSDGAGPPEPWPVETINPQFFVVDDMWNDWDRVVKIEVEDPRLISLDALCALRAKLRQEHPGWTYVVAGIRGYVRITADAIMVEDSELTGCASVGEVVRLLRGELSTAGA
jgi:hypothetical protein